LVLVFVTEIVHIFWINIFVLQYSSVIAHLFVYMKLYVFITVYNNYTTCRWHGSCRTYPKKTPMSSAKWKNTKLHKSRVICKVFRKKIRWHGASASKKMQNMSCQLTHTLCISHPTWTKIVYERMTTYLGVLWKLWQL
jgi:hypothetical protein